MSKPYVVVIHGMGTHTAESVTKEVFTPLDNVKKHFNKLPKFSESVNFKVIEYNTLCDKVRQIVANSSNVELVEKLGNLEGFSSFLARLTQLQVTVTNDDKFWKTHWLDVITYQSIYQTALQLNVATQLLEVIRAASDDEQRIHIIAHSLGTTVIHDTLHKLFKGEFTESEKLEIGYFPINPKMANIASITMVANVSNMLPLGKSPYKSIVRLLPKGITSIFIDARHALDPIPLLRPFNPPADWDDDLGSYFVPIRLHKVERLNVHDLDHYLADPKLYMPLLKTIFNFDHTPEELQSAVDAHDDTTAQGKFEQVVEAAKAVDVDIEYDDEERKLVYQGKETIQRFEVAVTQFVDFIKSLQP